MEGISSPERLPTGELKVLGREPAKFPRRPPAGAERGWVIARHATALRILWSCVADERGPGGDEK